jgi:hypothetical protein
MTVNGLANLKTSGSTGRIVNLVSAFEKHGTTTDYASHPMFLNPKLNRAIILKHTLRANERHLVADKRLTVTKLILPFQTTELSLGGYSFFLNEPGFDRKLSTHIGVQFDCPDLARDLKVLNILDALPAFDPFMLRERLNRDALVVARCYFDLSDADASRMRGYLQEEIGKIVRLAFAKDADLEKLSSTMTEKLMTDETSDVLEPLRQALGMSGEAYRDGVFAWKGFLYYSWSVNDILAFMPGLQREIVALRIMRATSDDLFRLNAIRRRVARCIAFLAVKVRKRVDEYKCAYRSLVAGDPMPFRTFLSSAPQHFLEVGDALGLLLHVKSYWQFRFPLGKSLEWTDIEEATGIFRDFNQQISIIAELADGSDPMAKCGQVKRAVGCAVEHPTSAVS